MLLAVSVLLSGNAVAEHPGAVIYSNLCVECHGADGQGVPGEYDDPLSGDRSIKALARVIEKTMPEQDETLCVGEDAQAVAEYIHGAFYSEEARANSGLLGTARIELSRLTVAQHRNAVADIIAALAPKTNRDDYETGGLRGSYFSSKKMAKKHALGLERVDPSIDFDFGKGAPVEGVNRSEFSIAWDGSIIAPHTGSYEFRVTTQNGVRLYVNLDLKKGDRNARDDSEAPSQVPLIDGWVSSGREVVERRARIDLLGGRRYPIRVDYFKFREPSASLKLEWKPPHGVWEVIDGKHLSPNPASRTLVLETAFPADDRSYGYERGISISKAWHAATTRAAVEAAKEVLDRADELAQTNKKDPERAAKLRALAQHFTSLAFRHPLGETERKLYIDAQFSGSADPEVALKRCVLLALKSPRFLYTDLSASGDSPPDGYKVASRLALILWDSIPDTELFHAAEEGQLTNPEQVRKQAQRMLGDPRAREKLDGFFEHWLEMEERDLSKDTEMFPGFDGRIIADLRHSLEIFIDEIVWGESSDYRQLLLASVLPINGRLAKIYGGDQTGEGFETIEFESERRAGVLTHPYLLSAFAYHDSTSPIHRGVFLTRNVVGRQLKSPPVAAVFKDDEFDPGLTMREKVTQLTSDTACMSCHSVINPLGFSLENFDTLGRWRSEDEKKKIDTRSEYTTLEGDTISLANARDIAEHAVSSPSAHKAFITALFHHAVKQPVAGYGEATLDSLHQSFLENDFHIRRLLVEIATVAALQQAN